MFDTEQAQQVGAAALAKFEIVGVIDNAREIGVLVIDADGEKMAAIDDAPGDRRLGCRHRSWLVLAKREAPLQDVGLLRHGEAEMAEGVRGEEPAARRAVHEALLNEDRAR